MRLKIVDLYSQNEQLKESYLAQEQQNAMLVRQQEVRKGVASRASMTRHLKHLHSTLDTNICHGYLPQHRH